MCLGNFSPIASRTSTSDLPTRSLAAANPPRSGTVSKVPHDDAWFHVRPTSTGKKSDEDAASRSVALLNTLILIISTYHHSSKDRLAFPLGHATGEEERQGREGCTHDGGDGS